MPIPDLITGWSRFLRGRFQDQRALFQRLHREGQRPSVAMVACCDSRVDPAIVFDCDPGDLFVVRNVANLVPPCERAGSYHGTSAALEFAVSVLEVSHIVVLGHRGCGGMRALLDGVPGGHEMPFLKTWIGLAAEARAEVLASGPEDPAERAALLELLAIRNSVRNLGTFPLIQNRVADGRLTLHGWHFDFVTGGLSVLDSSRGTFAPAVPGGTG